MSIAASFTGRKAIKIHGQVGVFSPPPALHSSSPAPGMRVLAIRARFRGATQMNGSVTISARSPDFQRAFVAMRYFWGMRGQGLADAHDGVGLQPAAVDVLAGPSARAKGRASGETVTPPGLDRARLTLRSRRAEVLGRRQRRGFAAADAS